MHKDAIESLLRENEVAKILNLSVVKIRLLRRFGGGPEFIRIGKAVRYRMDDIRRFIDSATSFETISGKVAPKREPITLSEIFSKESE
jgi:hypothetical protein